MTAPPIHSLHRPCRSTPGATRAFTLVELLVVVLIIGLLLSFLVPAFGNLGKAGALTSAGSQVANLVNLARQNSMSKNAMTALIVNTDSTLDNANRLFTLLELVPPSSGAQPQTTDWKPLSGWETIRAGVVADSNPANFSFPDSATQPVPKFPSPIQYGAKAIGSYKYVIFLPNGTLLSGTSTRIRLTEGFLAPGASTVTYTRPKAGGSANYYDITILAATGRTKIDRP